MLFDFGKTFARSGVAFLLEGGSADINSIYILEDNRPTKHLKHLNMSNFISFDRKYKVASSDNLC